MTLYRIASYLLMIVAIFMGIMDMMVLFIALANPAILIQVFIIACVVIYSFTSFSFLVKGIDQQRALRKRTKDLIKVNAYVAMFFAIMFIVQAIAIISNPQLVNEVLKQANQLQQPGTTQVTPELLLKIMKYMMYFFFAYSFVLLLHILYTLQLLRRNAHLFLDPPQE